MAKGTAPEETAPRVGAYLLPPPLLIPPNYRGQSSKDFLFGLFFVCVVTVLLAGYLVSLGMEGYAKVQKVCFYIGMAALALIFLVMLFGSKTGFQSAFNQEAANLFGGSGNDEYRFERGDGQVGLELQQGVAVGFGPAFGQQGVQVRVDDGVWSDDPSPGDLDHHVRPPRW